MRPSQIVGMVLIVLGVVVVALRGISYVKDREQVELGPVKIEAEERGFITPAVGVVAIVAGLVLVLAGRGRGSAPG
jgi:Na+-transporting methylmalonyl-CoA/oxaloacetate decarboxylase gamma subunit